mgnify:CR=1 FL=1
MDKKNNQNDNPNKKKNIKSAIILLVVCLGITALFTSVMSRYKNGSQKKISYSKFLTMLDKGEIKKVQVADRKTEDTAESVNENNILYGFYE